MVTWAQAEDSRVHQACRCDSSCWGCPTYRLVASAKENPVLMVQWYTAPCTSVMRISHAHQSCTSIRHMCTLHALSSDKHRHSGKEGTASVQRNDCLFPEIPVLQYKRNQKMWGIVSGVSTSRQCLEDKHTDPQTQTHTPQHSLCVSHHLNTQAPARTHLLL